MQPKKNLKLDLEKKTYSRHIVRYILLIVFFSILISIYKNSLDNKIFGCIDPMAINYDSSANVMKDSSCIIMNQILTTDSRNKVEIIIDTNKYSKFNYDFIYLPDSYDTIIEIKQYWNFQRKNYISYTYKISDTVKVTNSSMNRIVYEGSDVKVIENLPMSKPRKYIVDLHEKGTTLINPRAFYRYKTETAVYEKFPSLFGGPANVTQKYNGFCINMEEKIHYWFEDHPSEITVYDDEYSLRKYYRTNVIRY